MNRFTLWLVCAMSVCTARPAIAACGDFAHFQVVGESDFQCFSVGAGKVDLLLNKANGSGEISILRIVTSDAPPIRNVLINNQDPNNDFVIELYGETPADAPASIELIQGLGRTNVALKLDTTGNVGSISRIRELYDSTINGSVTGNIELQVQGNVNPGSPFIPRMSSCTITGDLEGSLIVAPFALPSSPMLHGQPPVFGIVSNVEIRGRLGTLERGSVVIVPGLIRDLRVGELNARVSGGQGALTIAGLDVNHAMGSSGDVNANITCLSLGSSATVPNAIRIAGALHADLIIGESIVNLSGAPEIAIGPMGLQGNIIIGAAMPFMSMWLGDITIGGAPLQGPAYKDTAASLGSGAVGLVPFALHASDCSPAPGDVLQNSPGSIIIAHYGPVTYEHLLSATFMPLILESRSLTGGPWVAVDTRMYHIEPIRLTRRDLKIVFYRPLPGGYTYRVRPNPNGSTALRCDIPGPVQPLVEPYEYKFTVAKPLTIQRPPLE